MSMTPEEFWSILHNMPEPKPVYYRLYYRKDGTPICYSQEELADNYIDVDPETFMRGLTNVRVVNGRLIEIHPQLKLKPSKALSLLPSEYSVGRKNIIGLR